MKFVERKPTTAEYERYACDKCGEPCGDSERYAHGSFHDRQRATVEREEGTVYPEGGTITKKRFDCCTRCFDQHVVPALQSLGFTLRTDEIEI